MPTAIFAAASHGGFEQAVSFAVRCGGDTDTLGAMAGALAGLENGPCGRRHVEQLAGALAATAMTP